jgi:hypothetical protein
LSFWVLNCFDVDGTSQEIELPDSFESCKIESQQSAEFVQDVFAMPDFESAFERISGSEVCIEEKEALFEQLSAWIGLLSCGATRALKDLPFSQNKYVSDFDLPDLEFQESKESSIQISSTRGLLSSGLVMQMAGSLHENLSSPSDWMIINVSYIPTLSCTYPSSFPQRNSNASSTSSTVTILLFGFESKFITLRT